MALATPLQWKFLSTHASVGSLGHSFPATLLYSGTSNVLKLRIYEKVWQRSKVLQNDPVLFVRLSSILSKNHLQGKVYAARRMTYSRSETYVFLEPGKDEQFVTLEELRKRVRGWLERWPEKSLPKDLTKFNSLEDAAAHLVQSACELEIGRGIGSIQWYEVNLE